MYSNSCENECDDYDDIGWWSWRRIRTRRLGAGPKVTSGGNGDRDLRSADAPVPGTELSTHQLRWLRNALEVLGARWNATDFLDALECSGMHKRSDLMGRSPFGFIGVNLVLFGALGFAPIRSECFCWIVHCINAYHCAFEWLAVEEVKSNLCAFPGAPLVRDGHRWGLFSHQRLVEHLYLQHLLH